jgi:hypothetical protein
MRLPRHRAASGAQNRSVLSRLNRPSVCVVGVVMSMFSCACGMSPSTPSGPVNASGDYSLTITASPSCAQDIRLDQLGTNDVASTSINLIQSGSAISGALSYSHPPTSMSASVSGQFISENLMSITLGFLWSNSLVGSREVSGSGLGAVGPEAIVGTFRGTIVEFDPFSRVPMTCDAADHEFVLKRVGL